MQHDQRFALVFAKVVDLLRHRSGDDADYLGALRGLVELTNQQSVAVRLDGNGLTIEGRMVSPDFPHVAGLVAQMRVHGVAEFYIAHGASAVDLVHLIHTLSAEPETKGDSTGIMRALHEAHVRTVRVLGVEIIEETRERRAMSLTDAFAKIGLDVEETPASLPGRMTMSLTENDNPTQVARPEDQVAEEARAVGTTLTEAVSHLRTYPEGGKLSETLNAITFGILKAVRDGRMDEAVEAISAMVRNEGSVENKTTKLSYSAALQRVLQLEWLRPLAKRLFDPMYVQDLTVIMQRAGTSGTQVLLDLLVTAPTFAERRVFLDALRQMEHGTDMFVRMLNHHEWYVVRNVADLVGDMHLEEGISALGAALMHDDSRVRYSSAVALAKIGTPATATYLRRVLREGNAEVRAAVAREVRGSGLGPLALALAVGAEDEENPEVRDEYYRALGRIGTPEAVQALTKAAQPRWRDKLHRRRIASRVAAAEGLALAGTDQAMNTLETLSGVGERRVREAVQFALREIQAKRKAEELKHRA